MMIPRAVDEGECPVELFAEDQPDEEVVEGERAQGECRVGFFEDLSRQAVCAAENEYEFERTVHPFSEIFRKRTGIGSVPVFAAGDHEAPGNRIQGGSDRTGLGLDTCPGGSDFSLSNDVPPDPAEFPDIAAVVIDPLAKKTVAVFPDGDDVQGMGGEHDFKRLFLYERLKTKVGGNVNFRKKRSRKCGTDPKFFYKEANVM
jgi:hypothetical protein